MTEQGFSSGDASDLYSRGARFEYRLGHELFRVFHPKIKPGFLQILSNLYFINFVIILRYITRAADSVVK